MRSKVFTSAWNFVKNLGISLKYALKRAWYEWRVKAQLSKGLTFFVFQKVNGEIREAAGTTNMDLIPTKFHPKGTGSITKNVAYFDLEVLAWRSFRKEMLIIKL